MDKLVAANWSNLPEALKKKDREKWSDKDTALARRHFPPKEKLDVYLSNRSAAIKKRRAALLKAGAKIMVMK